MATFVDAAAGLCLAAGLIVFCLGLWVTRSPGPAFGAMLDFFLAAGLLRLASRPEITTIVAVALVVAIRRLAKGALRVRLTRMPG